MNATGLIIGGKSVPCAKPVFNWNDHGMKFTEKNGGRKRDIKKTEIDLFVLHWTGGEGTAKGCFNVLNSRELGVEFYIGRAGEIYQFADPILVDTFDAGSVNPRSVGVEIANYGFRTNPSEIPQPGKDRKVYEGTIRGRKLKIASFYDTQLESAYELVKSVCAAIPTIPFVVPGDKDKNLFSGTLTKQQLKNWKGVLGHWHISDNKCDPGIDIFDHFVKKGTMHKEVL